MNTTLSIKNVEKISKALGDPYRLKIMEAVKKQDWMPCCEILAMIDLAQSTVSHHIKQLVDAELLIGDKDGRAMRYTVNKEVVTEYVNFLNPLKA